jgi:hypothetical protein
MRIEIPHNPIQFPSLWSFLKPQKIKIKKIPTLLEKKKNFQGIIFSFQGSLQNHKR